MALRMKVLAVQALTLCLLVSFNYQLDTAQSDLSEGVSIRLVYGLWACLWVPSPGRGLVLSMKVISAEAREHASQQRPSIVSASDLVWVLDLTSLTDGQLPESITQETLASPSCFWSWCWLSQQQKANWVAIEVENPTPQSCPPTSMTWTHTYHIHNNNK